jgi:hypothetical protein
MEYAASDLTPHERYKLLAGFVLPRPIAWVTTVGPTGVVNAAPYSFFNVFCEDPPLYMFAVNPRSDGRVKDTLVNVRQTGEFVVNMTAKASTSTSTSATACGTAKRCAYTWNAIIRSAACSPTATAAPTIGWCFRWRKGYRRHSRPWEASPPAPRPFAGPQ